MHESILTPDSFNNEELYKSCAQMIIGKHLGRGYSRDVYIHAMEPSIVVKIAMNADGVIANTNEFDIWDEVQHWKGKYENLKNFFCPVTAMSSDCKVLFMKRTQPLRVEDIPNEVYTWVTDQKLENFGILDGRLVIHDYGLTLIKNGGITNRKRKADFYLNEFENSIVNKENLKEYLNGTSN